MPSLSRPCVIDSSGNPPQNTAQTSCGIAITAPPAPLAVACPSSDDKEFVPYSSSLVATGGVPPYTFSLTQGSLPPGLSFNPSTGAVTGTDTTATGNYTFIAMVMDASGKAPANQAMNNCAVVAANVTYKLTAAPNTTPQSIGVNTAAAWNLAVIVTNKTTGKVVQGVKVTFTVNAASGRPEAALSTVIISIKPTTPPRTLTVSPQPPPFEPTPSPTPPAPRTP